MNQKIWKNTISWIFMGFALLSLFFCLAAPFLYFWGQMSEGGYKSLFLAASMGWFVFSVFRVSIKNKQEIFCSTRHFLSGPDSHEFKSKKLKFHIPYQSNPGFHLLLV